MLDLALDPRVQRQCFGSSCTARHHDPAGLKRIVAAAANRAAAASERNGFPSIAALELIATGLPLAVIKMPRFARSTSVAKPAEDELS